MAGFGSNAPSYRDEYEDDYDQGGYEQPRVAQRPRNVPNSMYGVPQYQPVRPGPLAQQTTRTLGGQGTAPRQMMPPAPMPTMPVRVQQPARRSQTQALRAPSMRPRQQSRFGEFMTGLNIGQNGFKMGLMLIGGIVALLAVYFLVSNVIHWWQVWQDDMTYGRPRTVQVDQWVGHSEEDAPSHFIVQNNKGQITVIEYPGGDVTKTRVIPGPRLFGKDSDLTPVKPRFQDVNGDNNVDMILSVDSEEFVYINEKGNFRPITPEERSRYNKMSGGNK
jgi:hypothetical protein